MSHSYTSDFEAWWALTSARWRVGPATVAVAVVKEVAHAGWIAARATTIDMILHCPKCGHQHVDAPEPENDWTNPPHKTHLCHGCGGLWRPTNVATNGVAALAEPEQ